MAHCIFVGCDAHVKNLLLRYAVDRGKPQQRSCANTRAGRGAMIRWLGELARRHEGATIHFAYETSCVGFVIYDELKAAGVDCIVVPTTRIPRSAHQRRNKCDVKDAQYLLDLLRGHVLAGSELPRVWVPDLDTRDAREVVRGRLRTAQRLTATRNEVFGLLKRTGVERPKGVSRSNWTVSHWRWLESLVAADGPLGSGGRVRLGSLLAQIRMLESEQSYFDEHIAALAAEPRYAAAAEAMRAVKGVSLLTAMVLLTELGDLGRFANRRQVAGYVGLVPSKDESGETSDRKGHITRQGPSRVRHVLGQAAWSWVRWDPEARPVYEQLKARNPKYKKIALVAMMRRLLIRLWHRGLDAQRAAAEAAAQG
jgi:transposase